MESWWCPVCEAGCGDWAAHAASRSHLEARAASPFPTLDVYPEPCDGSIGPATAARLAALSRYETFEPFGSVERR